MTTNVSCRLVRADDPAVQRVNPLLRPMVSADHPWVMLATVGDAPVGWLAAGLCAAGPLVQHIQIVKAWRGRGVVAALGAAMEAHLRSLGYPYVLITATEQLRVFCRFVRRFGCRRYWVNRAGSQLAVVKYLEAV